MKNAGKKIWPVFTKMLFLAILLTPLHSGFSSRPPAILSCAAPSPAKTGQSSSSITFSWSAVEGATAYKVWYVRRDDNYTGPETTTSNTSITYSNLPAGSYRFYFQTVCGEETSSYVMIDDLLM